MHFQNIFEFLPKEILTNTRCYFIQLDYLNACRLGVMNIDKELLAKEITH